MVDEAEARRTLARDSRELLDDPAFAAACLALRKQWFAELMAATHDDQILRLTYRLQALESIPQELNVFVNNQKMAERKK